jgi:feruloyl esterase
LPALALAAVLLASCAVAVAVRWRAVAVARWRPCPAPTDDDPAPSTPALLQMACEALAGRTIAASAIGLPTGGATVATATPVAADAAGNLLGAYCRVRGSIAPVDPSAPVINFAVNLPMPGTASPSSTAAAASTAC